MIKDIINKLTLEEKTKVLTYYELLDTVENKSCGIPKTVMADGPHGVRPLRGTPEHIKGGSTAFPTASALSATWNTELAYKTGQGIAKDCQEQGVDVILGPGVNIKRTPLCGRNFEYFSEDPCLAGEMGAAYINGVQSKGVGTCIKHFALNNQETARTSINVEVDERTLREIYLKPFEIAVKKSNPKSIMAAYNRVLGAYCTENKMLFDILRKEWDYKGAIISDWGAVHDSVSAISKGLNLQMPNNPKITEELKKGIDEGRISEEQIDTALSKLLEFIISLKESDKQTEEFDRKKQHQYAYDVASEAITLLKNKNNILPITKEKYKKVFVLGSAAKKPNIMGGGSSIVHTKDEMIDSPLEEIRRLAGDDIEVIYDDSYSVPDRANLGATTLNARKIIPQCSDNDLILCFVTTENAETEGLDRYSLHFENYIDEIIRFYSLKCKNVAVIMQTGTAYVPYRWDKKVGAVVQMWLLGEAGGKAIADVLFGKVNPSGKLSETFPKKIRTDMENIGLQSSIRYSEGYEVGYRYYDRHPDEVWYPFGHGLSYTDFEYSDIKAQIKDGLLSVGFKIRNTGNMPGKETAQIYIGKEISIFSRPVKELKAFEKVGLMPDEEKNILISIPVSDLACYSTAHGKWVVEDGRYRIYAGSSSADIRLMCDIEVDNKK
ncbi:MAG: glycoside hydrolase family 3 C-terminal domain-containing protein [Clostridia bacterium]|nr:glycoside hydrolase family 3 C-terminal domain-containing protein [Clostridia bacterium]